MPNTQSGAAGFSPLVGKLYLGTDQTNLVNGTWTTIALDTIAPNFSNGIEDISNNKITPGIAGLYLIVGSVSFYNVVVDKEYGVKITKNAGFSNIAIKDYKYASMVAYSLKIATICYLSATDYIQLRAMSRSGDNTVDVESAEINTSLAITKLQ